MSSDSYLLPADGKFNERVTLDAYDRMRERLRNTSDPTPPDYYLSLNAWLRTGFYYDDNGQIIGWRDPSPRCGDGK